MEITTESTVVVRLTEMEAGVILCMTSMVGGDGKSVARKVTDRLGSELRRHGIVRIDAFEADHELVARNY